ncbi:hypothetical protein FKW77_004282 [Venturia effusa]|uniref:Uncharacterized protein n=1 Tax=Venturia effusa TaxID=50376 RepID=A0A517LMS5_9PEZI|nr:hypothetical protein FKW77_004282 [Venturia effusa]
MYNQPRWYPYNHEDPRPSVPDRSALMTGIKEMERKRKAGEKTEKKLNENESVMSEGIGAEIAANPHDSCLIGHANHRYLDVKCANCSLKDRQIEQITSKYACLINTIEALRWQGRQLRNGNRAVDFLTSENLTMWKTSEVMFLYLPQFFIRFMYASKAIRDQVWIRLSKASKFKVSHVDYVLTHQKRASMPKDLCCYFSSDLISHSTGNVYLGWIRLKKVYFKTSIRKHLEAADFDKWTKTRLKFPLIRGAMLDIVSRVRELVKFRGMNVKKTDRSLRPMESSLLPAEDEMEDAEGENIGNKEQWDITKGEDGATETWEEEDTDDDDSNILTGIYDCDEGGNDGADEAGT